MEQIGQWNIYKTEDLIKTQSKSIRVDGSVGRGTITATGIHTIHATEYTTGCTDVTIDLPSKEMKPFYCPNCGGNSYRKVNGKIVCDYCDTEFLTSTIPSENPLKDLRPKPIPTRTTR